MSDIKTKFINDPENITAELLEGYVLAYPNQVKLAAEKSSYVLTRKAMIRLRSLP